MKCYVLIEMQLNGNQIVMNYIFHGLVEWEEQKHKFFYSQGLKISIKCEWKCATKICILRYWLSLSYTWYNNDEGQDIVMFSNSF